jgi:hypothetical protein
MAGHRAHGHARRHRHGTCPVVKIFSAAHPNQAYLFANRQANLIEKCWCMTIPASGYPRPALGPLRLAGAEGHAAGKFGLRLI